MNLVKKHNALFPSIWNDFFPENKLDMLNYETFSKPEVNISENFTNFVIELVVPGVQKEDIAIEIENDTLRVSSEKTETAKEEETNNYTRKEFTLTAFKRSFTLPKSVNKNEIAANYEAGILKIELPKLEEAKEIKRMVEIS